MTERTRRAVLRTSGALAAVAAAGSLAGCNQVPFLGGDSLPGYASWLPAPDELEGDADHYQFGFIQPTAILEFEDSLADGPTTTFEQELPIPGFDTFGDVERYLFTREAVVLTGGFDRDDVVDGLDDADFESEGSHEGYDVYESEAAAVAVSDETVVESGLISATQDLVDAVETAIDTREESVEDYATAEEAVEELLSTVGEPHLVWGASHDDDDAGFEEAVASAFAVTFDAEETDIRAVVVFEEDEADADDVEDWAEEADLFFDGDVETSTSGRVVEATTTVDTDDVETLPATPPEVSARAADPAEPTRQTPTAAFSYDYEETTDGRGVLTVTHDGGDSIPAAELYLRGTGFADVPDVDQTEAGPWQGSVSGDENRVVAGGRVDVGVTSDYEIDVIYESREGQMSATLQSDTGPDA